MFHRRIFPKTTFRPESQYPHLQSHRASLYSVHWWPPKGPNWHGDTPDTKLLGLHPIFTWGRLLLLLLMFECLLSTVSHRSRRSRIRHKKNNSRTRCLLSPAARPANCPTGGRQGTGGAGGALPGLHLRHRPGARERPGQPVCPLQIFVCFLHNKYQA